MNLQELTQLVALGEGQHIEFKRKVPEGKRLAKEVIAFANTYGGRLLLGVDDDGTITGVRDAEETEFALLQALGAHCDPAVDFKITRVPISRKRDVLMVHIPESRKKPHYVVDRSNGEARTAYVRLDDMSIEASREARRLMRAERSKEDVTFEFGDHELMLMRSLERYGRVTVRQFAQVAGIPPWRASRTLVLMTRAKILRLHPSRDEDYFTLAYNPAK
jgi:predicted HTH transcriptional regulator